MTKIEIMNKIEELENKMFLLAMADHWDTEDYELDRKWHKEVMELKEMLGIEKVYDVEFIKPNKRELEERVTYIATFDTLEEAKACGLAYERNNNDNVIGRTDRGYYNIKTREVE